MPLLGYVEAKKKTIKSKEMVKQWVTLNGTTMQFYASEGDASPSSEVVVSGTGSWKGNANDSKFKALTCFAVHTTRHIYLMSAQVTNHQKCVAGRTQSNQYTTRAFIHTIR
jgi:hypothetical protein